MRQQEHGSRANWPAGEIHIPGWREKHRKALLFLFADTDFPGARGVSEDLTAPDD